MLMLVGRERGYSLYYFDKRQHAANKGF